MRSDNRPQNSWPAIEATPMVPEINELSVLGMP
jgi:hypothetical protein